MIKRYTRTLVYSGVLFLFLSSVISCEEDFTDIGTSIVSNNAFSTNDTVIDVEIISRPVDRVRAGGIDLASGSLDQYLIGVYNDSKYEKIEASIVSQLSLPPTLDVVDRDYGADTTVVTVMDTAYLKIPLQATASLRSGTGSLFDYELDSIIGNPDVPFTVNIYQNGTYLDVLNPADPSENNSYFTDDTYIKLPGELNHDLNFQFTPNVNDTALFISRRLSNGVIYDIDTAVISNRAPFARIPLDKNKIKQLFLDGYETGDFASQGAFNDYFRGLIIEATGNDGSLVSLNFNGSEITLVPSLEIFYTNTIIKSGTQIVDTIKKNDSFLLGGIRNSVYKMTPNNTPSANQVVLQGAAGNTAEVKLFGEDNDNSGLADLIEDLRLKNWLINDAQLTFYVDQDAVGFDTIASPRRMYLHRTKTENGNVLNTHLIDILTEGQFTLGGFLEYSDDGKPDKYVFRITDHVSDLLNSRFDDNQSLLLKPFNTTDLPENIFDTIVKDYSWNPKAIMLLNHLPINGNRKAQLKISYSVKTEENN